MTTRLLTHKHPAHDENLFAVGFHPGSMHKPRCFFIAQGKRMIGCEPTTGDFDQFTRNDLLDLATLSWQRLTGETEPHPQLIGAIVIAWLDAFHAHQREQPKDHAPAPSTLH